MKLQRRNQLQRVSQIAIMIQNRPMSKQEIISRLEDKFDYIFSESQIEKDIFMLKMDMDAPIVFNYTLRKYEMNDSYDFRDALFNFINV